MLTAKRVEKKAHTGHTAVPGASPVLTPAPGAWSGVPRFLQAKLAVNQPDDVYEREADQVAEQVLRTPAPTVQRACAGCASGGGRCPACSSEDDEVLQRKAASPAAAGLTVPEHFLSPLGSGRPLDRSVRDVMEHRLGHDFAGVRVHTGEAAAATAHSVNALAYTVGPDVVFGAGQYAPETSQGQRILAHELTHVIQQGSAPKSPERREVRPDEAAPMSASGSGVPGLQRQATGDAGVGDAGPSPADAGGGLPGGVPPPPAPAGPDACATIDEEERKARFRARTFSALDFRPPTAGFGKFDAYYWPASSLMAAIVKMKFNYVQADNTPSTSTLWTMWRTGQDITQFFWSDTQKTQFAQEYRDRVVARWSFVHTFRSTKPCWPFTVSPYVAPRIVHDAADAHFEVTVHKSPGPGIDYNSAFRARNPGTPGWRGSGDLYQSDVREEPNFNSRRVAETERRRLERAIAAAPASPVMFAKDRAVVQPSDIATLHALADVMKAKNPSDPAIPIVITGFASSEGPLLRNEQLAEDRANAVADELRRAGVPQPLSTVNGGPIGVPDDALNRKAEIAPSTDFERTYATNRYSVGEHEFGHTIGLPDEYQNNTTGPLGGQQTALGTLAAAAGVAPPDQWGVNTSSVMSAGVDVLPRHYLTIWEALGQMTAPDITRNEWSIG